MLKSYLESGKFGRGSASSISAEAGLVMLANIEIDEHRNPVSEDVGIFRLFPNFLRETAFIDRFSGLLPGWYLPRISKDTPSGNIGFKGDIFGEILHTLRSHISYRDYVKTTMELRNCDDMRDAKAIEAGASGLLKILFPDKQPTAEEFYRYCVNPAVELRQRIRDELCKLDREYVPKTITSHYPDEFQKTHQLPVYYDINDKTHPLPSITGNPAREDEPNETVSEHHVPEPVETTISIEDGAMGYSYQNLFLPYLRDARKITVIDPYIRLNYQIKNFIDFCAVLSPEEETIAIHLITSSEDAYQQDKQMQAFEDLQADLLQHRIKLTYDFDPNIHDRLIETDTGWRIKPGRGLDLFQKPENWYSLGESDQAKRRCRGTEIDYRKVT